MAHTAPRIILLILAHSIVWSGMVTRTSSWCSHLLIVTEAVARDQSKMQYIKKMPQTTLWTSPWNNSITLTRHMSSLQWTNLYFPIQIYCSICSTLYPGVSATSSCARGTVVKKPDRGGQLVPKSQPEKSHWVGLVLHWGWETVPQVWKHRCGLRYNVYTTWRDMEVQADR